MIKTLVLCDFCERPLPVEIEDADKNTYNVRISRTSQVDTRKMFPHLCDKCATNIDNIFITVACQQARKKDLIRRYARINEERKEKLGTNKED